MYTYDEVETAFKEAGLSYHDIITELGYHDFYDRNEVREALQPVED